MDKLQNILPYKMLDIIERAGISTTKQIILLSIWDIKKLTNLSIDDIKMIKNIVCEFVSPVSTTAEKLVEKKPHYNKISTGCLVIDELLHGGFRRGTITEIYGESGSGKTQLALQAAAFNWSTGCVYICTEDLFPIKRFEQIKKSISDYSSTINYGNNVFVEHVTEGHKLLSCIRVRLPKLLEKNNLSLIVIDSVAAPFRSEYTNYVQRAEDLRELAMSLIGVAQRYQLAVLCINQVTASFANSDSVLPSLGLAWSNMVSTRLWLRKLTDTVTLKSEDRTCKGNIREISVTFAPDLPNSIAKLIISAEGILPLYSFQINFNK